VDFTIATTWYLNPGLTSEAGTYVIATNKFTNSNVPSGVPTTVYFAVTDATGGCTRTVATQITSTCACTAGTRTWTGATSTEWNTATNWDPACVPTGSDHVIIADVTNNPTISAAVSVKSVTVNTGGVLTIAATKTLTINGITGFGGFSTALVNSGTVHNNGTITVGAINSSGNKAVWNKATFNNNSGASINIDRSNSQALLHETGTFTNAGTITIGAINVSIVVMGLKNESTFVNNSGGQIYIDRSTAFGLGNGFGSTFTNSGGITIGANASVGDHGISNFSTFSNNACGVIAISAPFSN
jgi:hypothetical protein